MFCNKCGAEIPDGSAFCNKCGNKLQPQVIPSQQTSFVPAKCTNCGGILKVDASKEAAICPFCNQPYIVSKAINNINLNGVTNIGVANINIDGLPDAENLKERALNFERAGDIENALNYYNRALDLSPNDVTANSAVDRINNYPFFSSNASNGISNGKLFLMKDKLIFAKKKKQIDIPLRSIQKTAIYFINKKAVSIETDIPQSQFKSVIEGTTRGITYAYQFETKELAKQWETVINNALHGKYPPQVR